MFKKIELNSNLVNYQTNKAVLIKMPRQKFKFWFPLKLVRFKGKNDYLIELSIPDNFEFKLFRNGEGKHNFKEVVEEKTLTLNEFLKEIGYFDEE